MNQKESQELKIAREFKNPYVGLRPFRPEESDLFFGRDEHVDAVVEKLLIEQFVIVTGASGIGKSSLVSCGVIPEVIRRGSWKKIYAKIGSTFIDDLYNEVIKVTNTEPGEEKKDPDDSTKKTKLITCLRLIRY